MNNKGFAVSGIIYGVLVLFILLLASLLSMFTNRKNSLDELKSRVEYEFNTKTNTETVRLSSQSPYETVLRGYYHIIIKGNYKTVSTYVFLEKGEKINIDLTGSNAKVLSGSTSLIDISSAGTVTLGTSKEFIGTTETTTTSSTKNVTIQYINSKKHEMLENVRYIKDCTSGNNKSNDYNINNWIEIKAIYSGKNVALKKTVTATFSNSGLSKITDGNLTNKVNINTSSGDVTTKHCVTVDLGNNYNLDAVSVYHDTVTSSIYYGITYVSSDGVNYIPIRIAEEKENKYGISVVAFEEAKVKKRNNFYVAFKTLDDKSKWIRIFHHNNRGGKIMWAATSQVVLYYPPVSLSQENINIHKQSLLNTMLNGKSKYEFLLEYEGKTGYNRWIQTSNPVTTEESVKGYKKVKISWNDYAIKGSLADTFGGLCKSNSGSTLIDGTCGHGNWFYAIGAISPWNSGIPAFSSSGFKKSVDLWLKIS